MDERAVLSGESHGAPAVLVDQADDFLIELAQHHLDDVHDFFVGDAHALAELAVDAHRLEQVADLRSATVHDHRIHADQLEHHDVARETGLELGLGHRVATVLDDDRLVVEALDVGQRLREDLRFEQRGGGLDGHDGIAAGGAGDCTRTRTHANAHAVLSTSKP